MKCIKCGIVMFLITSFFTAQQAHAYTGIIGGTVTKFRIYNSEFVLFKLSEGGNPDLCDGAGGWIKLAQENGNEAQKRQYTALLSARISAANVTVYLNGCSNGGTSGYPLVDQVSL